MEERRKKYGWPFWFAVAVIAKVGYPLSYGVFVWLWWLRLLPEMLTPILASVYAPFAWAIIDGPEPLSSAVKWYAELWH